MQKNILDLSRDELLAYFQQIDQPAYRVDQLITGLYAKGYERFDEFTNFSRNLQKQLNDDFYLCDFEQSDEIRSERDGTTKYLWRLSDGMKIESVIIYEGRRVTFCISSQIGCALDCKFCATGKMGFLRNLSNGEIVEQVLQMKKRSLRPPTNIVFMGMGEPMLNYDQVMKAADCLSDPSGLSFNRKKITVSTSGIIKGIQRMGDENNPYSLAISLNAARQNVRQNLMPISRKYPLDELMRAAQHYNLKTKKRVTFEYVLIDGLNDSNEDAALLIALTKGITCKINLIPCNSDDRRYRPPSAEKIDRFERIINEAHRTVTVRDRKGWDIRAACGQLYVVNADARQTKMDMTIF